MYNLSMSEIRITLSFTCTAKFIHHKFHCPEKYFLIGIVITSISSFASMYLYELFCTNLRNTCIIPVETFNTTGTVTPVFMCVLYKMS